MTHRPAPGLRPRCAVRLVLVTAILGLVVASAPALAGAQEAPAPAPATLAELLDGGVDGLTAEARTMPVEDGDLGIVLEVTNDGDRPVDLAIPFGTLVVTEEETDQTLAVMPPQDPEVIDVAASGGTPTIALEPGDSTHDLPAHCTELDDGYPFDGAAVTPIDPADAALADTLRAAVAADADHVTTQSAVWWLTDQPSAPAPADIAPLLAVDDEAFAADPYRVIPDTGYTPLWMQEEVPAGDGGSLTQPTTVDDEEAAGILDESFQGPSSPVSDDDGGGAGPVLWVALVGLVLVATVVIAARAGRSGPHPVTVAATQRAGWYPDPWGSARHRYWDGQRWTTQVMR